MDSDGHDHDHSGEKSAEEAKEELKRLFSVLKNKVTIYLFTEKGNNDPLIRWPKKYCSGSAE